MLKRETLLKDEGRQDLKAWSEPLPTIETYYYTQDFK